MAVFECSESESHRAVNAIEDLFDDYELVPEIVSRPGSGCWYATAPCGAGFDFHDEPTEPGDGAIDGTPISVLVRQ